MSAYRTLKGFIIIFLMFIFSFSPAYAMVFPGTNWEERTPESQHVDSTILNQAINYLDANSNGVGADETVVIRNGYVIWKGSDANAYHTIYSGTKTFTTTILGLLIQENQISSIDSYAIDYYPNLDDFSPDNCSPYGGINFHHFASFTSGYRADNRAVPGMPWGDPTKFLTPLEPFEGPGIRFQYTDPAIHILGHILETTSCESLTNLFQSRIAGHIGMTNWEWKNYGYTNDGVGPDIVAYFLNPSGIYGGGIHTTPLDFARYGLLYLNRGNWNGQQLIDASWVDEATTNQVPLSLKTGPYDLRGKFGYMWYTNGIGSDGQRPWYSDGTGAPLKTYTLMGGSKNYCFIIPEWDMVIVRMSPPGMGDMASYGNPVWREFFKILSKAIATTYTEDFDDGDIDPPWETGGDYEIADGQLHMYHGYDLPPDNRNSYMVLRSGESFIYRMEADISVSSIYQQVVGLEINWRQPPGESRATSLFLYTDRNPAEFVANWEAPISPQQYNLGPGNSDEWYHLSMTLHDDYVTIGINGNETDIFHGVFRKPESFLDTNGMVHGFAKIPEDVDYYTDT